MWRDSSSVITVSFAVRDIREEKVLSDTVLLSAYSAYTYMHTIEPSWDLYRVLKEYPAKKSVIFTLPHVLYDLNPRNTKGKMLGTDIRFHLFVMQ